MLGTPRTLQIGALLFAAVLGQAQAVAQDNTSNRALFQSNAPLGPDTPAKIMSSCHVETDQQFSNLLRTLKKNKHFEVRGFTWAMPIFEPLEGLNTEKYREEFRKTCVEKYHGTYIYNYKHTADQ